ncbi:hypothetical protein [Leptolyngbya sp. FACHB-261]|uniref:hypothetical protein n=1 Tax=Leptolyngbya sp. FACHB-261 TaxID=2692806 RepID=UPI0016864E3A|nr:hypothetical protein [Leptolyngbya sp. FACHB-261]MBD2100955.1 hypothetical protein [Leptolyngbya sp. FACHB-261]
MSPRDADCSLVSTPFNKHWSHLCAAGILSPAARDALAEELTDVALECEKLPTTPFVKSTI